MSLDNVKIGDNVIRYHTVGDKRVVLNVVGLTKTRIKCSDNHSYLKSYGSRVGSGTSWTHFSIRSCTDKEVQEVNEENICLEMRQLIDVDLNKISDELIVFNKYDFLLATRMLLREVLINIKELKERK